MRRLLFLAVILCALAIPAQAAPHSACKFGHVTLAIARVPGGDAMRVTDADMLAAVGQWAIVEPVQGGANFYGLPRYIYVTLFRGETFAGMLMIHKDANSLRLWALDDDEMQTTCAAGGVDAAMVDAWIGAAQGSG